MTDTTPTVEPVKRGRGRPATGVTTKRNIRVGDVWDRLESHYQGQGVTMSDLVKRLLEEEAARLKLL